MIRDHAQPTLVGTVPIRCAIGECPTWNAIENKLYFTNGLGKAICTLSLTSNVTSVRPLPFDVAALAFDTKKRLIVSHENGVDLLNADDSLTPIYDKQAYSIRYANDMKVGPDGAIYVGTQSQKRKKISNEIDGKLYRISPDGEVSVLLDGLLLSNGMDWSPDQTKFYHTDSDTHTIKEYHFDATEGAIDFTGRSLYVQGVDGFCIDTEGNLYAGCWGQGHVAVIDTHTFRITQYLKVPAQKPTSCAFCGKDLTLLAVTSASYGEFESNQASDGYTMLYQTNFKGISPFIYPSK